MKAYILLNKFLILQIINHLIIIVQGIYFIKKTIKNSDFWKLIKICHRHLKAHKRINSYIINIDKNNKKKFKKKILPKNECLIVLINC